MKKYDKASIDKGRFDAFHVSLSLLLFFLLLPEACLSKRHEATSHLSIPKNANEHLLTRAEQVKREFQDVESGEIVAVTKAMEPEDSIHVCLSRFPIFCSFFSSPYAIELNKTAVKAVGSLDHPANQCFILNPSGYQTEDFHASAPRRSLET
jgi:hypothetical protein